MRQSSGWHKIHSAMAVPCIHSQAGQWSGCGMMGSLAGEPIGMLQPVEQGRPQPHAERQVLRTTKPRGSRCSEYLCGFFSEQINLTQFQSTMYWYIRQAKTPAPSCCLGKSLFCLFVFLLLAEEFAGWGSWQVPVLLHSCGSLGHSYTMLCLLGPRCWLAACPCPSRGVSSCYGVGGESGNFSLPKGDVV